jgi:heme-degrading monooxygenase HmoA
MAAALSRATAPAPNPIQLHVDLDADPARESELVRNFHEIFEPAIRRQPGFVSVRLLKLRQAVVGEAPRDANYRLVISFQTEAQRQAWVASQDHQRAWPAIERTLRPGGLRAILYEEV